jgi:hypothetical protein
VEGIAKPTDALADQKIALVRLFFHGSPLLTTPAVRTEAEQSSDPDRNAKHQSWMMTHFGTVPIRMPANQIAQRAKQRFVALTESCAGAAPVPLTETVALPFDVQAN